MSEMLTDLLQNIYSRISQLGKSIQNLQKSTDNLNDNLVERVDSLVESIKSMTESVEKEGEAQNLVFRQIGDNIVGEIMKFREKMGLKDLDEVLVRLTDITEASEEALKPETVDLLLHEVLLGIKSLKEVDKNQGEGVSSDDLLQKVDDSLSAPIPDGKSIMVDAPIPQPKITGEEGIAALKMPPPKEPGPNLQPPGATPPPGGKKKKNKGNRNPPPGMTPPPK
ncbi:MAG: hypothetical protein ACTSYI_11815 [Promethearchaeota archaeon]